MYILILINVLYFGEFEITAKISEEIINLYENSTIFDLVKFISNMHPPLESIIWDQNRKKISDRFSVVKNKSVISKSDFKRIKLNEGDFISFLMPIAGG